MSKFRPRGSWSYLEKLEKIFIRTLVLGFLLLAVIQLALPMILPTNLSTRLLILNESFEGEKETVWGYFAPAEKAMNTEKFTASITLRVENFAALQKAKILVNGEEVADFAEKEITIGINNGDEVSIDGSFYKPTIKVKVINSSPNIIEPKLEQEFLVMSEILSLGEVRLEE